MSPLNRVLVVEDFEPFRRFLCSKLLERPELQLIAEVSNGLEAVRIANEVQPELILLDISIPGMNGFEAARRICRTSPSSKILFVTENRSLTLAREAVSTCASGYLVKSDAPRELLPAIQAVLAGRQYISSSLEIADRRPLDQPSPAF